MKLKFLAAVLWALSTQSLAQISEQTSRDYEAKVQMSAAKEQQLKSLAESIINNTYTDVLNRWNSLASGFGVAQASKYQFQGSIGYHMALSLPDQAKSDADVAFLYRYNNGNTTQPTTPTVYASKFKELARDAFKARYGSYTYEIKNPVVAIRAPDSPRTPDHVDIAFFDELQRSNPPSPANCVTGSVTTSPCSELNWGITQADSKWEKNDRLNLTAILNLGFDRNPTQRDLINRAGKIFKEWRFKIYSHLPVIPGENEKAPSIALVTLMYNLLNQGTVAYTNTFVLLKDTLAKAASNNFDNGNCTRNPAAFAITAITYPYANLLDGLTPQEKQDFCLRLMDFKSVVEYAVQSGVSDSSAVTALKPCFPPEPCFGACSLPAASICKR